MEHPSSDVDPRFRLGLSLLLGLIAVWGASDLILDAPRSYLSLHVLFEVGFVILPSCAIAYLWRGWVASRRELAAVEKHLAAREAERDAWRRRATKFLRGLGAEIESQLAAWGLTPAEQQVALLILKGLGHREAAAVLGRSERTIRQHAASVYRKSGLSGRAELSAFFLEDLLLPSEFDARTGDSERPAGGELP